jgi:hypothetical protein
MFTASNSNVSSFHVDWSCDVVDGDVSIHAGVEGTAVDDVVDKAVVDADGVDVDVM